MGIETEELLDYWNRTAWLQHMKAVYIILFYDNHRFQYRNNCKTVYDISFNELGRKFYFYIIMVIDLVLAT